MGPQCRNQERHPNPRTRTRRLSGLTFSPDGDYIYYVRSDKNTSNYSYLYSLPVLGGSPRQLIRDIDSPVSFSPDGKQFTFMRGIPAEIKTEVRIANADGTGDHILVSLPVPAFQMLGASWSPDGKSAATSTLQVGKENKWVLSIINVTDGSIRNLYSGANPLGRPAWLPDGTALVVPFALIQEVRNQFWLFDYPSGERHRFTNDLTNYGQNIELTRDGQTLVATEQRANSHIWVIPQGQTAKARQITSGESADIAVAPGPQGKLLVRTQGSDLVLMNSDGTQRTQPFPGVRNFNTMLACGGRFFVFDNLNGASFELTRVDPDGSNRIILAKNAFNSACFPDGNSVLYGDAAKYFRASTDGSKTTEISGIPPTANITTISHDGKWIAYGFQEGQPVPISKIAVIPAEGGTPVHVFSLPAGSRGLGWSPDGKALQFLLTRIAATNLWEQPLSGAAPRQLTNFTSGRIFDFCWSLDGKDLFVTRGEVTSDVILISNFR